MYRPEIDGLRTVAVIPVILFHAGFTLFGGGYVGVDVFFVISGYLITGILIRQIAEGRFSILDFYERRARRILPALFAMMLATIPFAWWLLLPGELQDFFQSFAAASLSVSNILFWQESGYFAPDAELKPLLHTWSLGVEEQFYILFPPLLMLLAHPRLRMSLATQAALLATIAAVSLWVAQRLLATESAFVFYMLPTRAWELAVGGLCAMWHGHRAIRGSAILSTTGLLLILGAMVVYRPETPFPGLSALPPVLGSALVLLYATPQTPAGRLLSLRPMVGIGLISYSLYLWHNPVLVFLRHYTGAHLDTGPVIAGIVMTFALAWASWRFIETPFRHGGRRVLLPGQRGLLTAAAAGIGICLCIGGIGHWAKGFPHRFRAEHLAIARENDWNRHCLYTRKTPMADPAAPSCTYNGGLPRRAVLFGDSIGASLAPGLADALAKQGYSLTQLTHSYCLPSRRYRINNMDAAPCAAFTARSLDFIAGTDFDLVITAGLYTRTLGDPAEGMYDDLTGQHIADYAPILADMKATLAGLPGTKVIVGTFAQPPQDTMPHILKQLRTTGTYDDYRIPREQFETAIRTVRDRIARAIPPGGLLIEPEDAFCDSRSCAYVDKGRIYISYSHFAPDGAGRIAELLVDSLGNSSIR